MEFNNDEREQTLAHKIHCANHRVQSTLKDVVKVIAKFAECDKFYTNIF